MNNLEGPYSQGRKSSRPTLRPHPAVSRAWMTYLHPNHHNMNYWPVILCLALLWAWTVIQ